MTGKEIGKQIAEQRKDGLVEEVPVDIVLEQLVLVCEVIGAVGIGVSWLAHGSVLP